MSDDWGHYLQKEGLPDPSPPSPGQPLNRNRFTHDDEGKHHNDETRNSNCKDATDDGNGWAHNAPVYEFPDAVGDVAPRIPTLERMLFGDPSRCEVGTEIEK